MGVNVSNTNAQNTITSFTEIVNSTVSDVTQNIQTSCGAFNQFNLVTGAYPTGYDATGNKVTSTAACPFNSEGQVIIDQSSINSCGLTGGLTDTVTQDINTALTNNINQWLSQEATANGGLLGIGVSIASSQGIDQTSLSQMIANTVTSNLTQNCSATVEASNIGTVWLCGNYAQGYVVKQSAVNSNLTSCTVNNAVQNIGNDTVINSIFQQASQEANASTGITFNWLTYLIIGIVIIGVLLVLGAIIIGITYFAKSE